MTPRNICLFFFACVFFSRLLYKWNYKVFNIWRLTFFTQVIAWRFSCIISCNSNWLLFFFCKSNCMLFYILLVYHWTNATHFWLPAMDEPVFFNQPLTGWHLGCPEFEAFINKVIIIVNWKYCVHLYTDFVWILVFISLR